MGETKKPLNRAERRARGRGIGTWETGRAFRRPSSRVRVHRVPFDPERADRSGSRLHGRTRHGQAEDVRAARTGEAFRRAAEGLAKLSRSIEELRAATVIPTFPAVMRTGRAG